MISEREAMSYEFLGRFLGLAVSAAYMPKSFPDAQVRKTLIEIAEEYRHKLSPGALIGTEGQTVRGHKEGHEAGKS